MNMVDRFRAQQRKKLHLHGAGAGGAAAAAALPLPAAPKKFKGHPDRPTCPCGRHKIKCKRCGLWWCDAPGHVLHGGIPCEGKKRAS